MSLDGFEIKELTLAYLRELRSGRCSITNEEIQQEPDEGIREIMAEFLRLHEELERYRSGGAEERPAVSASEALLAAMIADGTTDPRPHRPVRPRRS